MLTQINFMLINPIMFFSAGAIKYLFNSSHLLKNLLLLEFMAVAVYSVICFNNQSNTDLIIALYFLIMVVCEGVLGLSLLIVLAYSHGSDRVNGLSMSIC